MKKLFFYVLHKNYNPLGGLVNSVIGCFATMEKPSIRSLYCWGVISRASDVFRGQLYAPTSSLLYKRRNPSPSQSSPLIRLFFFPQNRNRVSLLIPWFANHSFVLRPECWQSRIIPAQYCSFAWSIFRPLKISASYWEIRKIRHEKHEFCYRYFMTDECWF